MIRFLKRHVWPWSEIERLREEVRALDYRFQMAEASMALYEGAIETLKKRLAKYERPRGESGRFTSND